MSRPTGTAGRSAIDLLHNDALVYLTRRSWRIIGLSQNRGLRRWQCAWASTRGSARARTRSCRSHSRGSLTRRLRRGRSRRCARGRLARRRSWNVSFLKPKLEPGRRAPALIGVVGAVHQTTHLLSGIFGEPVDKRGSPSLLESSFGTPPASVG